MVFFHNIFYGIGQRRCFYQIEDFYIGIESLTEIVEALFGEVEKVHSLGHRVLDSRSLSALAIL